MSCASLFFLCWTISRILSWHGGEGSPYEGYQSTLSKWTGLYIGIDERVEFEGSAVCGGGVVGSIVANAVLGLRARDSRKVPICKICLIARFIIDQWSLGLRVFLWNHTEYLGWSFGGELLGVGGGGCEVGLDYVELAEMPAAVAVITQALVALMVSKVQTGNGLLDLFILFLKGLVVRGSKLRLRFRN